MSGIAPIKFVAIGGGTGLSTLLQGLKPYIAPLVSEERSNARSPARRPERAERGPRISLTALVAVTDDRKSTARLGGESSVLPPGHIRNCLVALADNDRLMTRLFRHRFPGNGALGGHSLGNLIILALN